MKPRLRLLLFAFVFAARCLAFTIGAKDFPTQIAANPAGNEVGLMLKRQPPKQQKQDL